MLDDFIDEWINWQIANYNNDDAPLHWTDNYLIKLLLTRQTEALWEFIVCVYNRDVEEIISILATGCLEDLLAIDGEKFIDRVEALALCHSSFKASLCYVWKSASMSDVVWERICVARGECASQ